MSEDIIHFLNNIDFENNDEVYEVVSYLYKENKQLKEQLERSEKARKEAIGYIEKFVPIDVDTILMREKQRDYLIEILDIDKGDD